MTRGIRVEPEAEADFEQLFEWYEHQESGLGWRLLNHVESAHSRIGAGDHGSPVPNAPEPSRRVQVPGFPIWIIFMEHASEAVVLAYAHERRLPGYWHA